MGHRIGRGEDISAALRRLLEEDLAAARAELLGNGPPEVRIHRVRQRLKRVRSLLRVERPVLGATAKEAKRAVGKAARLLAGARDADAAAASARGLRAAEGPDNHVGLDRLVATLDRQAEVAHRTAAPVAEVIKRLKQVETDLAAVVPHPDGTRLLAWALARSYRRGRRAFRRAETTLATRDIHRWRKDVKDLWHLLRLARRRLPGDQRAMARSLAKLGDLLGLDHDHAMLAERLALSPTADPALMRQLALIDHERRALEAKAFAIGARLYRRRPRRFGRQLRLA